jgi:uncharacterized protein (DUF2384 family)
MALSSDLFFHVVAFSDRTSTSLNKGTNATSGAPSCFLLHLPVATLNRISAIMKAKSESEEKARNDPHR